MPESAEEISEPSISSVGNSSFEVSVGAKPAMASSKLCSRSSNETSLSFSSSEDTRLERFEKGSSSVEASCDGKSVFSSAGKVSSCAGTNFSGAFSKTELPSRSSGGASFKRSSNDGSAAAVIATAGATESSAEAISICGAYSSLQNGSNGSKSCNNW